MNERYIEKSNMDLHSTASLNIGDVKGIQKEDSGMMNDL